MSVIVGSPKKLIEEKTAEMSRPNIFALSSEQRVIAQIDRHNANNSTNLGLIGASSTSLPNWNIYVVEENNYYLMRLLMAPSWTIYKSSYKTS